MKEKYPFNEMVIGETRQVHGEPKNIRSAASMARERGGIYLTCSATNDPCILLVKRISPPDKKTIIEGLRKVKEGIDMIVEYLTKSENDPRSIH